MKNKYLKLLLLYFIIPYTSSGQNLEKIGKSPLFKLSGGVGVNSIYYNGNSNRAPFTYFLSGNLNLNISDVYNIPFSFSYSNSKFQTNNPFTFNRLSLHPSYKWVTAHIGDVNMSFSPYTLNGHQFTGLGLDLSPTNKFKISVMYGRLLKAREFDTENLNGEANYRRIGYGFKTSYKFEKVKIGAIFFRASDDLASLKNAIPVENEITPKDNTVISFDGEFAVWDKLQLKGEVALSALTEDTRANGESDSFASFLVSSNATTQYYKAYNLNLSYKIAKGSIGIGYEFIDPNYKTLGGYFFNNDLENITINASQSIFKGKVAVNFNGGLQKDNIDGSKVSQLRRLVMAFNVAYTASSKLNITTGYSSFQSFTNIRNQFDVINGSNPVQQALNQQDISQISQNANLNVSYKLKESANNIQNLNFGFSYQDATNKVGETVRSEDASELYNANAVYTINYPQTNLGISGALNTSFSTLGMDRNIIIGPTVSANKGFLEKKLKVNSSLGYNQSINNGVKQGDITNVRVGARYVYKKKHNFSLNGLFQLRNSSTRNTQNFTLTFGYNYTFGLFNSKDIRFRKRKKTNKKVKEKLKIGYTIRFIYKDSLYVGSIVDVDSKIKDLLKSPKLNSLPKSVLEKLNKERIEIANTKKARVYKGKAIKLLQRIYRVERYKGVYNKMLFESLQLLLEDANRIDFATEKDFVENRKEIIKSPLWNLSEREKLAFPKDTQERYKKMDKEYQKSLKRLLVHRWVSKVLEKYTSIKTVKEDTSLLKEFETKFVSKVFKMIENKENKQRIKMFLQGSLIEFLTKTSEKHIDKNQYELKYINLN